MSTDHTTAERFGTIAFIGGGNMASAILNGLLAAGQPAASMRVVEPWAEQAQRLREAFGVEVLTVAGPTLASAELVVWAVKPQSFAEAAAACQGHVGQALQLSVMAGITSPAIARASGSPRVVRCMPNTPALIGQGMTGLYADPQVSAAERHQIEQLIRCTGDALWVARESDLDTVTALSGSGPAYVFYFIEAMIQAGTEMGLPAGQARQLAQSTFAGAAALAAQSPDSPELLRQRVTSRGGTTDAAVKTLDELGVKAAFVSALHAASRRAHELGRAVDNGPADKP